MLLRGRHRHVGVAVVVELDGDADLASLPQLTQALNRGIELAEAAIIVDLDGLTVVDDAALGLLVGAAATARRRGIDMQLLATADRTRTRLAATRLDRIIEVVTELPIPSTPPRRHESIAPSTEVVGSSGRALGSVTPAWRDRDIASTRYTAVIFTSRRTSADEDGYAAMAARMNELAREQPGYRGIESARGPDGVGITVSYWDAADAASAWKRETEHLVAQSTGRSRWYDEYTVRITTVEREYSFARPIFHMAIPDDWRHARTVGTYGVSTRGLTVTDEGFMHCSFVHQLRGVAERFYADVDELTILHIDRRAVDADVRLEPPAEGIDELFPHLYRELMVGEVVDTTTWRRTDDGWGDPPFEV